MVGSEKSSKIKSTSSEQTRYMTFVHVGALARVDKLRSFLRTVNLSYVSVQPNENIYIPTESQEWTTIIPTKCEERIFTIIYSLNKNTFNEHKVKGYLSMDGTFYVDEKKLKHLGE